MARVGKMKREENAPQPLDPEAASAAVDNLAESDPHRRRTLPHVDQTVLVREAAIGERTRKQRRAEAATEVILIIGAWAAVVHLAIEILKMAGVAR